MLAEKWGFAASQLYRRDEMLGWVGIMGSMSKRRMERKIPLVESRILGSLWVPVLVFSSHIFDDGRNWILVEKLGFAASQLYKSVET